ncbi:hypothetical protein P2318_31790 [Myxococcaceae bacterium GXIMD 01537]
MSELSSCPSCQGFNPASAAACLHCGHARAQRTERGWRLSLWTMAGAGLTAMTLMACYGAPPCPDGEFDCYRADPEEPCQGDAGADADAGCVEMNPDAGR